MSIAKSYYRKWLLRAPLGLVLIGFGACLVAEAAMDKYDGAPTWEWVVYGTLALVVFNSGLSIFGDAILQRCRYERLSEKEEQA
jgi:peptidoglycan/LPS O-acetylase OafA/YrhL